MENIQADLTKNQIKLPEMKYIIIDIKRHSWLGNWWPGNGAEEIINSVVDCIKLMKNMRKRLQEVAGRRESKGILPL